MTKYILITGVSSGIGLGLAKHYLHKQFNVIGTVRKYEDGKELEINKNFHKIIYDVKDKSGISNFVSQVENIIGNNTLFALVNNAGIVKAGPLELVKDEDFEEQIEVNVNSVRRITNAMIPLMSKGSRIIMISSVSGLFNSPFTGPYCISKHAIESMSDIYRRELNIFDIKVIAIEPGPIKSKIWGKSKGTLEPFKDTKYGHITAFADKAIESAENSALEVSYVCDACDKALFKDNPRARYIVHKNKLMFNFFAKYIPTFIQDKLVAKTLKEGKKHRTI
jgi:hypothetical protein